VPATGANPSGDALLAYASRIASLKRRTPGPGSANPARSAGVIESGAIGETRMTPLSVGDESDNIGSGRFKKGSMALEVIR
jgi:hypothetical protein